MEEPGVGTNPNPMTVTGLPEGDDSVASFGFGLPTSKESVLPHQGGDVSNIPEISLQSDDPSLDLTGLRKSLVKMALQDPPAKHHIGQRYVSSIHQATGAPDDPSDPGSHGDQGGIQMVQTLTTTIQLPIGPSYLAHSVRTRRQCQRARSNRYQHIGQ
jgi:hypothetical protein